MPNPARRQPSPAIAVLCSGQGTNLQAVIHASRSGSLRARVGVVICDRADAYALVRAQQAGIPAHLVQRGYFPDRAAFERALIHILEAHQIRLVCLAGFMRMLSPVFVRHYANRILNVHPALLPAFPGSHAVQDALAWGVKVTGVTVHLVDEEVDHGPIVLQEAVPIQDGEKAERLLERLHQVEHRLYPRAIQLMLSGRVVIEGRRVVVKPARARRQQAA